MSWFKRKEKSINVSSLVVDELLPKGIRTIDRLYRIHTPRKAQKLVQGAGTKAFKKAYGGLKYMGESRDCDDFVMGVLPTLRGRCGDVTSSGCYGWCSYETASGVYHRIIVAIELIDKKPTLKYYDVSARINRRTSGLSYRASALPPAPEYLVLRELKLTQGEIESIYAGEI